MPKYNTTNVTTLRNRSNHCTIHNFCIKIFNRDLENSPRWSHWKQQFKKYRRSFLLVPPFLRCLASTMLMFRFRLIPFLATKTQKLTLFQYALIGNVIVEVLGGIFFFIAAVFVIKDRLRVHEYLASKLPNFYFRI